MIKSYFEFLNESLILESDVIFSDKFRKIINKIEHPISKQILDIENKDLDVRNNFFDVSFDKNDKVSFIPDAKAQELLTSNERTFRFTGNSGGWLTHKPTNQEIFDKLGYEPDTEEKEFVDEETGDIVKETVPMQPYSPSSMEVGTEISRTVSETSGKTFVYVQFDSRKGVYNIDKLSEVDPIAGKVWSKNRQEIKVGKGIRAILKSNEIDVEAKDLEEFVNLFKATMDKMNDKFSFFQEVKGEEIAYWYKYTNYAQRSGTLGTSCMSNVPSEYFDIYVKNPDVCSLLIFKSPDDESKILARALLWTTTDGKKFLDRIYTINDSDVQLFKDYAKENGWYSKINNNSTATDHVVSPSGEYEYIDLTVDVESGEYDSYPYLDTLKYYDPNNGTLSTEEEDGTYTLESTEGHGSNCERCDGREVIECYDCDGRGEVSCGECDGERTIECYDCDGDGTTECSDCDGNGREECFDCDGTGKVEDEEGNEIDCSNCSGDGDVECSNCDGDGNIECSNCDGDGENRCDECSGDGDIECESCWGRGEIDCYECQ